MISYKIKYIISYQISDMTNMSETFFKQNLFLDMLMIPMIIYIFLINNNSYRIIIKTCI